MGTVHTDWDAAQDDPRQLSTAELLKRFTNALTACLILALAEVMPGAVAALIVVILWALVGAALALLGRSRMRDATPVAPLGATEGLKEDVRAAKDGIRAGRAGEFDRGAPR